MYCLLQGVLHPFPSVPRTLTRPPSRRTASIAHCAPRTRNLHGHDREVLHAHDVRHPESVPHHRVGAHERLVLQAGQCNAMHAARGAVDTHPGRKQPALEHDGSALHNQCAPRNSLRAAGTLRIPMLWAGGIASSHGRHGRGRPRLRHGRHTPGGANTGVAAAHPVAPTRVWLRPTQWRRRQSGQRGCPGGRSCTPHGPMAKVEAIGARGSRGHRAECCPPPPSTLKTAGPISPRTNLPHTAGPLHTAFTASSTSMDP